MGSKRILNFNEKFIEKGLIPLDNVKDAKQKVDCVDLDGYKYHLSYRGSISDKRTKEFDKWDKTNPFKAYNMRLYASRVQKDVIILSDDDVLMNATHEKIEFICPLCKRKFQKKWCHWINMPIDRHVCPSCNDNKISVGISQYVILTQEWLDEHHIDYLQEYIFDDCKYKRNLRFDFCIEWNNSFILIEVDGIQHFYENTWTTKERLKQQKIRDNIKNEYCLAHNHKLVRIPYWLYRTNTYKEVLYKTFFG